MPHTDFDVESLARYLHISPAQVTKMAERGTLPGRKISGQWRFAKAEVHHWLEDRIGAADDADLQRVQGLLDEDADQRESETVRISDLLVPAAIAIPLAARTRNSAILTMVEVAAATGLLWDAAAMAEAVRGARIDCTPRRSTMAWPSCTRGGRCRRFSPSPFWLWAARNKGFRSAATAASSPTCSS